MMARVDPDTTSRAWIARLKDNPQAQSRWEALSNRYDTRLRVFCVHIMGPRLRKVADPEDIINEAWLRVLRKMDGFDYRGQGSLYNWLCQQVKRVTIDFANKEERRKTASHVELDSRLEDEQTIDPAELLARHELEIRMAESLEKLPATYRDILVARLFEEKSYPELSELTGTKENTLAQQVLRGLELWRRELGQDPLATI